MKRFYNSTVNLRDKIKYLVFCKVNEECFRYMLITFQETKINGPPLAQFKMY